MWLTFSWHKHHQEYSEQSQLATIKRQKILIYYMDLVAILTTDVLPYVWYYHLPLFSNVETQVSSMPEIWKLNFYLMCELCIGIFWMVWILGMQRHIRVWEMLLCKAKQFSKNILLSPALGARLCYIRLHSSFIWPCKI